MAGAKKSQNKVLTVPNALSALRIIIVPFVAWAFVKGHLALAVILVGLSGLTDLLDGYIARRFDQITELGKLLDPVADKLTQGVVALCLALRYPPIAAVLSLFIIKEVMMLICGMILIKKKRKPCPAQWYGKVGTAMFYVTVSVILVMDAFFGLPWEKIRIPAYIMLALTALMMIYSAVRYFQIFLEILHSDSEEYRLDLPAEMHLPAADSPKTNEENTIEKT